MRYFENIEKIFADEIRDKRKTGSGSFHKRGKGVKHGISGALRTPYYYMSNKDKKKLNGEVTVSFMYETILNWTEFQEKDKETQRILLTKWREIHPNQKIMKELAEGMGRKFNSQSYANLVNELGCPSKQRGGSKPRKAKAKEKTENVSSQLSLEDSEIKKEEKREVVNTMLITKGLHLEYNGEYDVDALNRLFTKLQLLVDGESCQYNISLSLSEVQKD